MKINKPFRIEFDLGDLVKGETSIHTISFNNEFEFPYNIRKFTPYCPCIKILEYTKLGAYPINQSRQRLALPPGLEGKEIIDEEFVPNDDDCIWNIKFSIKKTYLGKGSTSIDVIFESPFDVEIFGVITVKYNVITE